MEDKPRILIVDDDESTCRSLRLIFGRKGYETETAGTGREAIEKAQERSFNLALLDIKLPDMEGVELLAPLKEIYPDMEVLMVTAYASLETAVRALNEGASAYITKPLNMDEVLATVRGALEKQHLVMEKRRAEEQIQRHLQRITALREIDIAITASLDLRVTFNILLDQLTAQLGVDAANVLLFNPHTQTLEYIAGRGFRSRALQHTRLHLGEGHAGLAALERRIVSIPNIAEAEDGLRHSPLLPSEEFIAYYGVPLIAKGQIKGVLEIFHRASLDSDPEWLDFLEALAGQAAIAVDNATLFDDLQRSNLELTLAYDTTLEGWARALELRDIETEGHTRRVTDMTLRLARTMGMGDGELIHVRRGALLHDIGKMGIPDSVLNKPGPLTDEEWDIMHRHPTYAYELLLPIRFLRPALDIPYCHHERWDGTGYPRGLKGEQIPLAARVFAVVDVWDALNSDRPYSSAWPEEKVVEYIREQAGKHFDPRVVEMFMKLDSFLPHSMAQAATRGPTGWPSAASSSP